MVVLILSFVSFAFYSPPIHLGAFSSCFLITSFTSLSVTLLVCNAAFKLNHWDSLQKWYSSYQLTTKTVNKTSTGSAPLTLCCSFNSLQISVKTKWLNSKKKKKKKKKNYLKENWNLNWDKTIYSEEILLDLSWSSLCYVHNFTEVKCNSKISNIYHHMKFRKSIMNRSTIEKLFLKLSQYS